MLVQDVAVPARDAGDAFGASLTGALALAMSAIPRILGFIGILIVGWLIASLVDKGITALLRKVRFNDLAQRSGISDFVRNMGVNEDSSGFIGTIGRWFVRLITLVVAFDVLGLPAVSNVLNQLLFWLPNLVVAMVVLVVGGLAAKALGNLVRASTAEAGFGNPDILGTVARVAVWSFAIIVAINQLGIATTLINTLLIGVVGALALASGIAFGLGGRDRAAQAIDSMSRRAAASAPQLQQAAQAAGRRARVAGREASASASAAMGGVPGTSPASQNVGVGREWVERATVDRRQMVIAAMGDESQLERRSGFERRGGSL